MKLEKLEWVVLKVPNMEESIKKYEEILGIKFEKVTEVVLPSGATSRCAYSTQGVELVEAPGEENSFIGGFHFRVKDISETKRWIEDHGEKVVGEISVGKMDVLITNISGIQICFIHYPGDSFIQAIG
jgi:predicted enzyme related to lactoylglutathione lyase